VIVAAGQMDLRGQDEDMAIALIFQEGYQKKGELRVKRGMQELMLPSGQVLSDATPKPVQPTAAPTAEATSPDKATPTAGDHARQPAQPQPEGRPDNRSALQRQLDALPGVRRDE
jgi:hypothetical protein